MWSHTSKNLSLAGSPKRILVIQTAFLGDVVLTTPFLQALRAEFPEAKIDFLATPAAIELLEPNPWKLKLISYDKRGKDRGFFCFLRLIFKIRKEKYERIYCLHRSFRSGLICFYSGAPFVIGFQEAPGHWAYHRKIPRQKYLYEAEKNLALLQDRQDDETNFSPYPQLFSSQEDMAEAKKILATLNDQSFVAISPSSVWPTKRWPAERFADLALALWNEHAVPIVILSGKNPDDVKISAEIANVLQLKNVNCLNLAGKTKLGVLKTVIGCAKVLIANDSAPLHIAIAMNVPVLGVFGPTTKELGFFPLAPDDKALVAEINLPCRPCGLHGHKRCPLGHFRCMLDNSVAHAHAQVNQLLT